jgi:sugar lactone lactonase YvrE
MMLKVSLLRDARATLGEGPLWDGEAGGLWWVDIKGRRLHRTDPADPARDGAWGLPSQPGCLATCTDGTLLVAAQDGLRRFDPASGRLSPPMPFETDRPGNRANDGKPGPDGAFWVGTMADAGPAATGGLWRLAPGAAPRRVLDGIGVSNSLCWSPDGSTLYHADSRTRRVLAYPFDRATGGLGAPRPLLDLAAPGAPALPGNAVPDGATVDAEGRIWLAVWEGGCVLAVTPAGEVAARIDLPVKRPTCPAFGGPELRTLFVTSAALEGGGPDGAVLAIGGTGAQGLAEPLLDWPRDQPPTLPS